MDDLGTSSAAATSTGDRRMVRAELLGDHTHITRRGSKVHIWIRQGRYMARGRHQGRPFGLTLGNTTEEAKARLHELVAEIERGAFAMPSEVRKRQLSSGKVPRLTLRELANEFLGEKRRIRGKSTAGDYGARLGPALNFAEQPASLKRWPLAEDINRDFVVELRTFLHRLQTTRNGRPGAKPKPMSGRQIINVMECLRTMLSWACSAKVRKLPADWANPLSADLIPERPRKDPLRGDPLPLASRIQLVAQMDLWQFCHLALSVILPLRPEEATGLLVSGVDFDKNWLEIGTRLDGADFTKARTSFKLPFPQEMRPILHACIGGRAEGPLLRARKAFEGRWQPPSIMSAEAVAGALRERLSREPDAITERDRKDVFRQLLREWGGVSEDRLTAECEKLLCAIGAGPGVTLYTLRGSVTRSMSEAGIRHLELRYLTSHDTSDILNEYTGLDPVGAIRPYFDLIRPLLAALTQRAQVVGLIDARAGGEGPTLWCA